MPTIGIAELSHRGSDLVRKVEQDGEEFAVTRQGRDTGVVLTRRTRVPSAPTAQVSALVAVLGPNPSGDGLTEQRLAEVERGRDQAGEVG